MSGTSLDGIDVAIVEVRGSRIETIAFRTSPYPRAVRDAILGVSNTTTTTASIAQLSFLLGEMYAEAVEQTCRRDRIAVKSLELIGCHGQTIYHQGEPQPFSGRRIATTLQIGEASVIAERLGIPVVSDFRTRDMAAGGKGAPLVPFVDYLLFRHPRRGRVALNIGGIANITAIPPGARSNEVYAFDTGPGNMVMDALAAEFTGGKMRFDRNGRMAARGRTDRALLDQLLEDPYYRRQPPKTAGREQYGSAFVERLKKSGLEPASLMATATSLTAATITAAIERFVRPRFPVDDLIISGGGAHNPILMASIAALVPGVRITTTLEFGISVDAKEAIAFAILAYQTYRRRPANLPSATGARHPVILGKITP
jgi:anhydro-N-acetylmuramic acid kinase